MSQLVFMMATVIGATPSGSGRSTVHVVFDQDVDAFQTILARRIHERREPTGVGALGAALGGDMALPVAPGAARIDVSAVRNEQLHHLRMAARARPHERGLVTPALARIDLGAVPQQQLRRLDIARARHFHQGSLAFRVGRVSVRSRIEQQLEDLRVAGRRRHLHGRGAVIVGFADLCARLEQALHFGDVVAVDGPLQRRAAVGALTSGAAPRSRGITSAPGVRRNARTATAKQRRSTNPGECVPASSKPPRGLRCCRGTPSRARPPSAAR